MKSKLSDWNWTRTHNHLVHKRTLNYLAKLAMCHDKNMQSVEIKTVYKIINIKQIIYIPLVIVK